MLEPVADRRMDPLLAARFGGLERADLERAEGRDTQFGRSSSYAEAIDIPRLKIEFV